MLTDAQRAESWVEHDGGECPVDPSSRPAMMFKRVHGPAWVHDPQNNSPRQDNWQASFADWSQCIAYRKEPT